MNQREASFLLIGLGSGLILAVVAIVELLIMFHHMFIVGVSWRPGTLLLAIPFLLIFIGMMMLRRSKTTKS